MQPVFEVTAPPTSTFAADFPDFLRIDQPGEIAMAQAMRDALVHVGERFTGRVFRQTTFRGTYPDPCKVNRYGYRQISLGKSPVTNVSLVEEHVDGAFAAVSDAIITLQDIDTIIEFPTDVTHSENVRLPIRVTFTAGYAVDSEEREMIDQALKNHLGYAYENRGDVAGDFSGTEDRGNGRSTNVEAIPEIAKLIYTQLRIIPGFG